MLPVSRSITSARRWWSSTGAYPGIQLDVIVNDRVVDPVEEGFDIAFQIFPPISESLIERRLFTVKRLFCASPAYLDAHGAPQHPRDLLQHTTALYSGYPSRNRWTMTRGDEVVEMELPGMIRSNSVHLLREYALSGGGVVPADARGERGARRGPAGADPDRLSARAAELCRGLSATQRQALKVKALVEFLAETIGDESPWDRPSGAWLGALKRADYSRNANAVVAVPCLVAVVPCP